jgi:hypothetical protein
LAVTNTLIMSSLRDGQNYDERLVLLAVKERLRALAREKEADAERIREQTVEARSRPGMPQSPDDFRALDSASLVRRAEVTEGLARRLREVSNDNTAVAEIALRARDAFLDEFANSVELLSRRLAERDIPVTRDERRIHSNRLDDLRDDLKALGREHHEDHAKD